MQISVRPAREAKDVEHARTLMRRYAGWTGIDLCFQGFDEELAALPGKYAPPAGELFVAIATDTAVGTGDAAETPVGVIAVRAIAERVCEMKRLWVEPKAQGHGLGRQLANAAIGFARSYGYREMKLDTLRERMPAAIKMYRSLGFVECEAYVHNPEPDVLYFSLALDRDV